MAGLLGLFGQGGKLGSGLLGMGGPQGQVLGMQPNKQMLNAGLGMLGGGGGAPQGMPQGAMQGLDPQQQGILQAIMSLQGGGGQQQPMQQAPQATGAPMSLAPMMQQQPPPWQRFGGF